MSRQSTARLRRCSLVLAVALLSALVAPTQAIAGAPVTTPTITAPANGATVVSSPMLVSADSAAAFVRFVVEGQVERTVAVAGGSAVTEIPVHGLDGSTSIEAYDCASLVSCGVSAASITVVVQLTPPTITAPSRNDFVGNRVSVKVKTTYGAVRFFVNGSPVGKDLDPPYAMEISLRDRNEGEHFLMVQQCNTDGSICEGETDLVKVIKDTKAPRWTEVKSSAKTVFPVNDNYKDSTRLSARLSENAAKASIEIRKAGGPIVRTLNLGREASGGVSTNWNGRKANGDIVPAGRYTFRFIAKDRSGLTGKSDAKNIRVSDKRLVRERVSRTVSAWGSKYDQFAGSCSSITRVGSDTVGLRSNSRRNGCTDRPSEVITAHKLHIGRALKLGDVKISALGGKTPNRPGLAGLTYIKDSGDTTTRAWRLGGAWGWHSGGRVDLDDLLIRGRLYWAIYTLNGYWYDVQQFRVSYTVTRLR